MKYLENLTRTMDPEKYKNKWDTYRAYLESIRAQLPANVYDFALADWRFKDDHRGLHDAWVDAVSIVESAIGGDQHNRKLDISIRLLGPYHDGHIELCYADVHSYRINLPAETESVTRGPYRHGDWLVDEIRLSEKNLVLHEIEFCYGSRWTIECRDLTCQWKPFH